MKVNIDKKKGSIVEIRGEIPFENLQGKRQEAVKNLGQNIEMKGFRKGNVPEKVVVDKVGEQTLLNEMANLALQESYPKIIVENELNPIAQPKIEVTKLAKDNPLEFKIEVAVMPEVELPDYKALAKEVNSSEDEEDGEVTDEEVQKVIGQIRESQKNDDGQKPEMTDELAKSVGDFEGVDDMKKKIREGLKQEKSHRVKDKRRVQIIEKIIEATDIDLPEIAIESELQKMMAQFKSDVARMNMKWEDYLEKVGKGENDLKKEWRPDAAKRAKSQIILNKIAVEEEIFPNKEAVEKEAEHITNHHKDADPRRAKIFAEQMLTNEKVFQFLEKQAE